MPNQSNPPASDSLLHGVTRDAVSAAESLMHELRQQGELASGKRSHFTMSGW